MNSSKSLIFYKLERFVSKYYWNDLLRGTFFFFGLGLLYFLFTLFIEYFLWLTPFYRTILFIFFIVVEVFLLFRYILFPVFKLFKLKKGITFSQASSLIGTHFPEVKDKLLNFIQLSATDSSVNHELLAASIDQKALDLQPIPFTKAINYSVNLKFLPLVLVPIFLFFIVFFSGQSIYFNQSLNRVLHYNTPFSPPAPFQFKILNKNLQLLQNQDFELRVSTVGSVVPENVKIFIGDVSYFMTPSDGYFSYRFTSVSGATNFYLESNSVVSPTYSLDVLPLPVISNFEMVLHFPGYLNKASQVIKGYGNAIIPEGTTVSWKIATKNTKMVSASFDGNLFPFTFSNPFFSFSKNIAQNTNYQIITSNSSSNYKEKLSYQFQVVTDQFPSVQVSKIPDSISKGKSIFRGQVSDDYGLSKLQIVYFDKRFPSKVSRGNIPIVSSPFSQFVFSFPSDLKVVPGVIYDFYFEVFDNDAPHNFKSAKSEVFVSQILTPSDASDVSLQLQKATIKSMSSAIAIQKKQNLSIDNIQNSLKQQTNFDFNNQNQVTDFINKQLQVDRNSKKLAEKLKESLEKKPSDAKDDLKKSLENRLDKIMADYDKNKKLLEELKNATDKLKKEDLDNNLEKLQQNFKSQAKSLEQLVELTKKYYAERKAEQIADKLNTLAKDQEKLSNTQTPNPKENQEAINKQFDKIKEELNDLQRDNKDLKAPLDLPKDDALKNEIDKNLNDAKQELEKNQSKSASSKQKAAAKNMQSLSDKISSSLEGSASEQLEEDVKMLRQVLDNLLTFSNTQEDVMRQLSKLSPNSSGFNKRVKLQQDLKVQFKHIDDSLFTLSLRNPKFSDLITKEVGDIQYNLNQSISSFTASKVSKSLSHQQYVVASSNKLGDFLSDLLNNLQMQMSGASGASGGKPKPGNKGMQLPDIIQMQKALGEKVGKGISSKPGDGNKPGSSGSGANGSKPSSTPSDENSSEALLAIYKEQRQLRDQLEKLLSNNPKLANGRAILDKMKAAEAEILNKGFNNQLLSKLLNINQELLKLKNATQLQEEDSSRQSNNGSNKQNNNANSLPKDVLDYINSIEILNRQSLPLQNNFNRKVQDYFNTND